VRYGTPEAFEVLEPYMREYGRALEYAHDTQERLGLSLSKGATAIAPNGTIGIVMESTPSADPMFSKAEIRTVVEANVHGPDRRARARRVDLVAERAEAAGVPLEYIEDAYDSRASPSAGWRRRRTSSSTWTTPSPARRTCRRSSPTARGAPDGRHAHALPAGPARHHVLPGRRARRPAPQAGATGVGAGAAVHE
jgi:hypothetical protein